MAGGPQFRPADGVQVFNDFDKPIMRTTGDPPCDCCDQCAAWLQCLKRCPIRLDLAGFDFSEWVKWVLFVWDDDPLLHQTGFFSGDGDGDGEFVGPFVCLPKDLRDPFGFDCNTISCFEEFGECRQLCGTHQNMGYRTIWCPTSAEESKIVKKISVDVEVQCATDPVTGDKIGIRFVALLAVEAESGPFGWTFHSGNYHWRRHVIGINYQSVYCCPILASDVFTWDELDVSDFSNLQDVALHTTAVDINGDPYEDPSWLQCEQPGWWWWGSESICVNPPVAGACIGIDCDAVEHDPPVDCPHGSRTHAITSPPGCGPTEIEYCIPPPIISLGDQTLSVLSHCRPRLCEVCAPQPAPPEGPKPPDTQVTIDFEVDRSYPGSCTVHLTALIPACIDVDQIVWSYGDDGLESTHVISNLLAGQATERGEIITLFVLDTRGCWYTCCKLVTCGCCPGTSGNLSITSTELNEWRLCASTNGVPEEGECDGLETTIVWQVINADQSPIGGELSDGDCTNIHITGTDPKLVWNVKDGRGCLSPDVEVDLQVFRCKCCDHAIWDVHVYIDGWVPGFPVHCGGACGEINGTWQLHPVGFVDTCLFEHRTAAGHSPEIFCESTGDPPFDWYLAWEMYFTIDCSTGDEVRALVQINAGAYGNWYKHVNCGACSGAPGEETDCSSLNGLLELDELGVHYPAAEIHDCNPNPASVELQITFAT